MAIDRETTVQLEKLKEMIKECNNQLTTHQQKIHTLETEQYSLETEAAVYIQAKFDGMANDLAPRIESIKIQLSALRRDNLSNTQAILKAAESLKRSIEKDLEEQELYEQQQSL